jgi:hypothetical protein
MSSSTFGANMHDIDTVLSDLEWRRLRRRVSLNPALALICNCGTALLIVMLKLAR